MNNLKNGDHQLRFSSYGSALLEIGTMSYNGDASTFTLIENIATTTEYQENIVTFDQSYDDVYIAFKVTAANAVRYLDNIYWEPIPDCEKPQDVSVGDLTEATAAISWASQGSATQWEVVYGHEGFDREGTEGTSIIVDTQPEIELIGLDYNTFYDVHIRSVCSNNELSSWALEIGNFKTECQTGSIPYFEGFEIGQKNNQNLECWTQERASGSQDWKASSGSNYNRTPRTGEWMTALGINGQTWMFYPLELQSGITYELELYAKQTFSNGTATIEAAFGTSDNAAAMTNTVISQTDPLSDSYERYNGYIIPETTGTYYVGIKGNGPSSRYLILDDISVKIADGCFNPANPAVANVTENSADITWTPQGNATQWEVVYGIEGFDLDANDGTSITVDNDPEITLENLDYNTTYDVYVRSVCGTEVSEWALNLITFKTDCHKANIPFFESFEIGQKNNQNLECWTQERTSGSNDWKASSGSNYNRTPRTGDWLAIIGNNGDSWMFYPLELEAGIVYELELYAKQTYANGTGTIEAAFGMEDNAAAMTNRVISQTDPLSDSYQRYNGYIIPESSGTFYIGIKGNGPSSRYLIVDDISVKVADGCFNPANPAVANVTENSADITWSPQGNATQWEVVYGIEGFDVEEANAGTSIITNDTEVALEALDYNTAYDVYVRSICGDDELSDWALNIINFKTDCQYGGIPFFEGFEIGQVNQQNLECWTQEKENGTYFWRANTTASTYNRSPRSGEWNIYLNYQGNNQTWMFYPLELTEGMTYELVLYARQSGTDETTLEAAYGVTGQVESMTNTIFPETGVNNGDYQKFNGYITPASTGTYYIGIKGNISTSNSRYLSVDDISVEVSTLSIKDHQTDYGIQLYPNPSQSGATFYVSAGQFEGHKVLLKITDVLGKTIYSTIKQFDAGKIAIEPKRPFGSGIYFVHLDQNGRTVSKRLIVN